MKILFRNFIFTFLLIILKGDLVAQVMDPVKISYSSKIISSSKIEVHTTFDIESHWHVYAQEQPKNSIIIPTKIKFNKNPLVEFQGSPHELGKKEFVKEKDLNISNYVYAGRVDFVEVLLMKQKRKTNITGSLIYQVCSENQCLRPTTVNFIVPL